MKVCVLCQHWACGYKYDHMDRFSIVCDRGYYHIPGYQGYELKSAEDLRFYTLKAETCADFLPMEQAEPSKTIDYKCPFG